MIEPRRFSRFRVASFAVFERAAVLLGGRILYRRRHLRRDRLAVREETIVVAGLPAALDGFTITHLSDLHAGPFLGPGDLADVVAVVEELGADVVCWTGDFVVHGIDNALALEDELRRCSGRLATYVVFGNHDYFRREEDRLVQAMEPCGWRFLRNSSERVEVDGASVGFCGIEDPEEGKVVDVMAATEGLRGAQGPDSPAGADVVIALAHGPQAAPAFAARGVRLVLSGHTHGTQVDLPFLRDLGPAHPGLRVELGETTLVVSRGLGAIGAPVRWGVPAEIVFLRLRAASG